MKILPRVLRVKVPYFSMYDVAQIIRMPVLKLRGIKIPSKKVSYRKTLISLLTEELKEATFKGKNLLPCCFCFVFFFLFFFVFFFVFFSWQLDYTIFNPCPAEPGYTLPLQTV